MVVIIGYFVSCLIGIGLSKGSDNPVVSFIGYNLVVVPVGVILSIALTGYEQVTIMSAIYVTGIFPQGVFVYGKSTWCMSYYCGSC